VKKQNSETKKQDAHCINQQKRKSLQFIANFFVKVLMGEIFIK